MKDHILILTVGLPRSGKSTWAQEQSHPIVSPDSIRLALHGRPYKHGDTIARAEPYVWAIAKTMVRSLFISGHNIVVVDACNHTSRRRADWADPMWNLEFAVIPTSREECLARISNDKNIETELAHKLAEAIDRMSLAYEPVLAAEGCIHYNGEGSTSS
jgi:predicted kinase